MDDPLWGAEPPLQQGHLLTTGLEERQDGPSAGLDALPDGDPGLLGSDASGDSPIGERWSLPARPLAHVLTTLRADDYMADGDVATFARGLGLDPDLTRSVLAGEREQISGEEVVSVCEALRCSPFDIWEADPGRITDIHDPGRDRIEALDEGPGGSEDHSFVRRRLDHQVRAMVMVADDGPRPSTGGEPVRLEVTRYRQADVLAIGPDGHRFRVSDHDQPAQPGTDYHFTFRRIGETETVTAPLPATAFAQGNPPGHGVEPRLASLADTTDPGADMVRFRDPSTGIEQWVGRETPFDDWQSWDDPRRYYPGDPADVLDDRSITDQPQIPFEAQPAEINDPGAAELNDGLEAIEELGIDF